MGLVKLWEDYALSRVMRELPQYWRPVVHSVPSTAIAPSAKARMVALKVVKDFILIEMV